MWLNFQENKEIQEVQKKRSNVKGSYVKMEQTHSETLKKKGDKRNFAITFKK